MRLTLVRHAHPEWPEGPSPADPGLSPEGLRQAAATAELLGVRFSSPPVIWSSPSRRALETARALAGRIDSRIVVQEALQGLLDPELRRRLNSRQPDATLLAGLAQLQAAVQSLVEGLLAADEPPADAIFVTHDAAISSLVCRTLAMELHDLPRFRVDLASVTTIDFRVQRTILTSLNETHHL